MSKNDKQSEVVTSYPEASTVEQSVEKTVPIEMYEGLYTQAVALEARYKRLFELYNKLLEAYLSLK